MIETPGDVETSELYKQHIGFLPPSADLIGKARIYVVQVLKRTHSKCLRKITLQVFTTPATLMFMSFTSVSMLRSPQKLTAASKTNPQSNLYCSEN